MLSEPPTRRPSRTWRIAYLARLLHVAALVRPCWTKRAYTTQALHTVSWTASSRASPFRSRKAMRAWRSMWGSISRNSLCQHGVEQDELMEIRDGTWAVLERTP